MKLNTFLIPVLISFTQATLAQVDSIQRAPEPFVLQPAVSNAPLVILKSDDRSIVLDPRKDEVFDIESIDSKQIQSITVLKNENARALYGEKGVHGVLIIQLVDNYIFSKEIYKKIRPGE